MKIIVDTSEQTPLHFSSNVTVVNRSLNTGDYSIVGYENLITVERKSLPDLVKSMVTDWQRFSRVLRRMAEFDCAVIVVESSAKKLLDHQYVGNTNPISVRGKINRTLIDFGISTVFLDDPVTAANWVENLFQLWIERHGER
jgi:ERCC4-type nuclease